MPSSVDRFSYVASDLLSRGHTIRFSAPGTSMSPTIRSGETIHVEPVSGKIRPGDILLYRWERGVRAHRVVRIEGKKQGRLVFILRGDTAGDDERVLAENILGRVISLERDGRSIRLRGPAAFVRRALRRGASRIIQAYRKSLAAR
jgi:signal peptidase I